jgi:hypothetical protein
LLDHLHDALDLALQAFIADLGGLEAQGAGAHAVDQLARRVLDGSEEVGLGQRQAQHRHLQARKPHADAGRDALLGQDGLEHQGHDLDDGLFARPLGLGLQLGGALAQLPRHPTHVGHTRLRAVAADPFGGGEGRIGLGQRLRQRRRGGGTTPES